jgi:ubiquinone/menaquinone biosynthesis C-methylase UbiE
MVDLDEYRQSSRQTWGSVAPAWKERRDWLESNTGLVNHWLVDKIDPQPGGTYLDVAGGPGDLALRLAERVGPGGRVLYTDFAPEMVAAARELGAERGAANIDYRVLDAERMDLDDDSVDGVGCRYGYMLMADPAAALAETRRVLRDGGPFAFAVWSTPERNPWAAVPGMTLVQRGLLPSPDPSAPGIFAFGMPERIRELVTGAGFAEPEIEEIAFTYTYEGVDRVWEHVTRLAGPIARVVNALPEDERQATMEAILQNLEPYRDDDGAYTMPASNWAVFTR